MGREEVLTYLFIVQSAVMKMFYNVRYLLDKVQELCLNVLYCHVFYSWLMFLFLAQGKVSNTVAICNAMALQNLLILKYYRSSFPNTFLLNAGLPYHPWSFITYCIICEHWLSNATLKDCCFTSLIMTTHASLIHSMQ